MGVNVTVHVAMLAPGPGVRVHVAEGVKVPVSLVVKLTVPVGMVGVNDLSMTRAVHVVGVLAGTEPGPQETRVCVGWVVGVTVAVARLNWPVLDVWDESPV